MDGDLRERVTGYVEALDDADEYGGMWWDGEPDRQMLFVGFTSDVARHARELRRVLEPREAVGCRLARFSLRELEQASEELWAALHTEPPASSGVQSLFETAVNEETNQVEVHVTGNPAVMAPWLYERWGARLDLRLYDQGSTLGNVKASGWTVSEDGLTLHLHHGRALGDAHIELHETDTTVWTALVGRLNVGPEPAVYRPQKVTVALRAPLGGRQVADAYSGRQLSAYPGP